MDDDLQRWPRPSVAVDVALLTVVFDQPAPYLAVLLHRRGPGHQPGRWALPGRMLRDGERLEHAARQALSEKAGVQGEDPQQLGVFDEPDRDDRGRVLSVGYADLVPHARLRRATSGDDGDVVLAPITGVEGQHQTPDGRPLGYDHDQIIERAVRRARDQYREHPDPAGLLPEPFTIRDLRVLHAAVEGAEPARDAFRRSMEPQLDRAGQVRTGAVGKPAALYRRTRTR